MHAIDSYYFRQLVHDVHFRKKVCSKYTVAAYIRTTQERYGLSDFISLRYDKFCQEIETFVKNQNFGRKSNFWAKNRNVGQKSKFWSKIETFLKNRNFG